MREIKFRGKSVESGEWIYGDLIKGKHYYISTKDDFHYAVVSIDGHMSTFVNIVIPESVGEYTGLHDKNGKEIYEGDICKRIRIVSDEYPEQYMPRVPAHPKTREWEVVDIRKITLSPECRLGSELITCRDCLDLEIIGNVHENTELLEEHA